MRPNPMRERWQAGDAALGGWLGIPSTVSAQMMATSDLDYACIDQQHGAVDYSNAVPMLQAIELGSATPIARVPWNEPGIIGKTLDAGAMGVIVPMVNSAAEAEAVVRSCRYAPAGTRSFGPTRVALSHADYFAGANDEVAVIPMIETTEAVDSLDEILSVPGIDAIYVGPADLSLTLGLPPGNNDDEPAFVEALETIVAGCRRHGIVAGIHASAALTERRLEMGFRMITVTGDTVGLRRVLAEDAATARGSRATGGDAIY